MLSKCYLGGQIQGLFEVKIIVDEKKKRVGGPEKSIWVKGKNCENVLLSKTGNGNERLK